MRAAIVLAAGRSRRFGTANKLLSRINGTSLVEGIVRAALREPVGRIIVMLGYDKQRVGDAVRCIHSPRLTTRYAANHDRGHRHTLLAGLKSLRPQEREVLVFLADAPTSYPGLTPRLARNARGRVAARPTYRNLPGHPVFIRNIGAVIDRLEAGLSPLRPQDTGRISVSRRSILDIDRPADRWSQTRGPRK